MIKLKKNLPDLFCEFNTKLILIDDKYKEKKVGDIVEEGRQKEKKKAKDSKHNIVYNFRWRKC